MDELEKQRSAKIRPADEERFMRRVDWNLFRQFYEIVQAGSLSGAARKLNLHQPSLSAALKRLEDHLGMVLCRRTSQGIELTPAGKAMMQLASEMVEAVRLAPHLTSQAANHVEGSLSIRMISNVISPVLNDSLSSFHRRHPHVAIKIDISPWREVIEAVSNGECDIGVTCDSSPRPHLQYEPLVREVQQLYCGKSHRLFGHRIREAANLSAESFILTSGDEPEDLQRFRKRYGLGMNVTGEAEDLHETRRLIELGIGIGFLPTIVAGGATKDRLWPILSASLLPTYSIYMVAPPTSRLSTPTLLFLQEARRRLRARHERVDPDLGSV